MKVYAIKASGTHGGGMAIVVARTEKQALTLASRIECSSWCVLYWTPDQVEVLGGCQCEGPARVLTYYENGE